jgi:signal transduction histidine kinase/ActR/RegA family two-component response regulator
MLIRVSYRYLIYGVLFGGCFPVLATLIISYQEFGNFSYQNILTIQTGNPLIWIIDTAPLFLGFFALKTGYAQQKVEEINENLEKKVIEQTSGIKRINEQLRDQIKERKLKESELLEAMEAAKQGVLSKDQFLSNMSHEIRTPMNGIIGMTDILLNTNLTKNQRKYLSAIEYSAKNLHVIINDILDLSKINAEKLELEHLNFKIREVLESVQKTLKVKVDEKAIGLHINIDNQIPEKMSGDPVRLNQILLNIVGNAVKFTKKGEVTVNCSLSIKTEQGFQILFEIIDTGIGIKKEDIKYVFESFSQANSSIARKFGGTGLGLPISKKLIELHGGKLHLESEYGQGTTFSFKLNFGFPLVEPESLGTREHIEIPDEKKAKIKILLAEDNKINQLVAKRFINRFGFQLDIANDGKEAIKMVRKNNYDLILMDIQMPELDGLEATRFIRTKLEGQKKNIKIMAMTASVLKKEIDRCYEAGMDGYIPKPFDPDELYEKIIELTFDS